jgi:hypothetical protein
MKSLLFFLITGLACLNPAVADQFVLFDETFTFEEKDAVPTKSHLHVFGDRLSSDTPKDWTSPVDYRNGTVHIRIEVLEKPAGDAPTYWSLCYIPVKGRKNNYGCVSSPSYTKPGTYEKDEKMTEFWENDSIVWTEGIKHVSLVLKGAKVDGKSHAHLQPDLKKFFPTRIRVTMVQVSSGSTYDPSGVAGITEASSQ